MKAHPATEPVEVTFQVLEADQPSAWELDYENNAFTLQIRKGMATFRLKFPMATLDEAERRIDEFLHSWEGDLLLQTGRSRRDFRLNASRAPAIRELLRRTSATERAQRPHLTMAELPPLELDPSA